MRVMEEIPRSKGTTKSERYLAQLADRTFLNLWAYPNVYREGLSKWSPRRQGALRSTRGLWEPSNSFLVIKLSHGRTHNDVNVAWPRWYKHAVKKSAKSNSWCRAM